MYKRILLTTLLIGVLHIFCSQTMAQYTLDEIGFNAGAGAALYNFEGDREQGVGVNANVFYGHYFCGKAYGIHTQGGFNFISSGDDVMRRSQFQFEGGFFFKLKRHDYHRSKEWAVLIGPKFQIPIVTSTYDKVGNIEPPTEWSPVVPVAHISFQFRRPAPEKKSWFIQPGVEYGVLPDFNLYTREYRRTYIFLHFGYAFFDKRG